MSREQITRHDVAKCLRKFAESAIGAKHQGKDGIEREPWEIAHIDGVLCPRGGDVAIVMLMSSVVAFLLDGDLVNGDARLPPVSEMLLACEDLLTTTDLYQLNLETSRLMLDALAGGCRMPGGMVGAHVLVQAKREVEAALFEIMTD